MLALTAFTLLLAGAALAEDEKEDKKSESGNVMAEMNKKLEELARRVADQKADNEELRKEVKADKKENEFLRKEVKDLRQSEEAQLRRLSDAQRRRDFAAPKTDDDDDDTKLRKAQLRKADAGVRRADADLREADLKTREEDAEKKELKRQSDVQTQENVEYATRALIHLIQGEIDKYDRALKPSLKKVIREKLKKVKKRLKKVIRAKINGYFATFNKSQELKKVIRAEINGYFASGARRLIAIGNGKAKWDSDAGSAFKVEQAFSTTSINYGCAGWSASANSWKKPWPIMIWYEFSSTHIPARFSFRQSSNILGPKEWRFVGSNGCTHGSMWETLCGDDNTPVVGEEVGCDVPNYYQEPFKCLGISVYSTNNKENNMVCLIAMQFWERLTSPANP